MERTAVTRNACVRGYMYTRHVHVFALRFLVTDQPAGDRTQGKNLKEDWVTFVGREPLLDEHPERRRRPRMGILHRRSNPEDHL
ncbi:hypothetical protein PUN28_018245 [Cardiocondyla obscurior]|uniref:Uncharacterized protein n=1 Tax=Cardiocondyla obscurior TaxID=286306 RepID=A0AAW2EGI4_9HYME